MPDDGQKKFYERLRFWVAVAILPFVGGGVAFLVSDANVRLDRAINVTALLLAAYSILLVTIQIARSVSVTQAATSAAVEARQQIKESTERLELSRLIDLVIRLRGLNVQNQSSNIPDICDRIRPVLASFGGSHSTVSVGRKRRLNGHAKFLGDLQERVLNTIVGNTEFEYEKMDRDKMLELEDLLIAIQVDIPDN